MSSTRAAAVSIHATSPELIASPVGTVAFGTGANKATSESATSKRNGRGFARFMCILVEKTGTDTWESLSASRRTGAHAWTWLIAVRLCQQST